MDRFFQPTSNGTENSSIEKPLVFGLSARVRTDTCGLGEAKILKQWSADKLVAQWKREVRLEGPVHSIEQFYLNKTLSKDVGPEEDAISHNKGS